MEAGMMKVVFSSIINGANEDLPANKTSCSEPKSVSDKKGFFKPDIRYSQPKAETNDFVEKSTQEVFASLVNASNCANLQSNNAIDGYLTWTAEGALLRDYRR